MKKSIKWKENIHWPAFITGVVILCLSLLFQAWDMAAVSIFGISGVVVLFIYNCWMDWKNARKIDAYKAHLAEEGRQRVERDLKSFDSLD